MKHRAHATEDCAELRFLGTHLCVFEASDPAKVDPDDPPGKPGQKFGAELRNVDLDVLPTESVTRSCALKLAATPNVNVETVCAAIMAWGGMRKDHARLLFNESDEEGWVKVAQDIRNGGISRKTAYRRLRELRQNSSMKGTGPAYFTKLIYFLMPRQATASNTGYIMDQWAGCSINLLVGSELVLMNVARNWKRRQSCLVPSFEFTVSDENTSDDYEAFCCAVDRLACRLRLSAEQVDRALHSDGGQNPKPWREYVMTQRQPVSVRRCQTRR